MELKKCELKCLCVFKFSTFALDFFCYVVNTLFCVLEQLPQESPKIFVLNYKNTKILISYCPKKLIII